MKKTSAPFREKINNHDNLNEEIKNKRRKSIMKENREKKKNFMEMPINMIEYVASFLSISECFDFKKLNKRGRKIIMTTHKPFSLYIRLRKIKSLTFKNVFKKGFSSELDVFKHDIIREQLNEKETEILFRDFFYSITNVTCFFISNRHENLRYYIKLLFSHPKCLITILTCRTFSQIISTLIGDIFENNSSIQFLYLENFTFTKNNLVNIKLPLESKCLTNISIHENYNYMLPYNVEEYNDCFSLFLNSFNKGSSVKELKFHGIKINKETSLALSDFIKVNKTIEGLTIAINVDDFSDNSDIFHDAFRHNSTLERLCFTGSWFIKDALENLFEDLTFIKNNEQNKSLPIVSNLKHIDFSDCRFGKKKIKQVCQLVNENSNIIELDLSLNKLHGRGFPSIISLIIENKSLKKINLSYGRLKNKDFKMICEALLLNYTLESVQLYDNKFSCSNNQIVELFTINKTLKEFKIGKEESECQKLIEKIMLERKQSSI